MTNFAVDLVAVAAALPSEQRRLAHLIFQLRDAHSIRTDLALACDFVASLKDIRDSCVVSQAASVAENCGLALFYSAIVLYVRATKTSSKHRRSFDFQSEFDLDELGRHKVLSDLRDDAIAHFGPGGSYAGPAWQKDGVFVVAGDARIMTASRRLVLNPTLIRDLDRQAHRALIIAERWAQERNAKAADAINTAIEADSSFAVFCRSHAVALAEFFGSETAASEVLSGPRIGARKGKMMHG